MARAKIGVIHGRFQPLHLGHMEYLLAGKSRCDHLIVAITNPDPFQTADNKANPSRSKSSSNPFTFYERMLIIRDSLIEAGVRQNDFDIVPLPINFPDRFKYYVPLDALFFLTVYDEWGHIKVKTFKNIGLKVDVMWERTMAERLTSGTEIRNLMAEGGKWEQLVTPAAVKVIKEYKLDERIREIMKEKS